MSDSTFTPGPAPNTVRTAAGHGKIPRVKGQRREVRRLLARRSKELLARYRRGEANGDDCPLAVALTKAIEPSR